MQGKKPTREQRRYIISSGLDSWKWMVCKDLTHEMLLVNKYSKELKTINKDNVILQESIW